jgi:hypothetical protein
MKDLKLIECRAHLQSFDTNDQAAILYMWIQQDHISMRQFTLLYNEIVWHLEDWARYESENQHTT